MLFVLPSAMAQLTTRSNFGQASQFATSASAGSNAAITGNAFGGLLDLMGNLAGQAASQVAASGQRNAQAQSSRTTVMARSQPQTSSQPASRSALSRAKTERLGMKLDEYVRQHPSEKATIDAAIAATKTSKSWFQRKIVVIHLPMEDSSKFGLRSDRTNKRSGIEGKVKKGESGAKNTWSYGAQQPKEPSQYNTTFGGIQESGSKK